MGETTVVFLTALCSGLIATFVTILWQKKSQVKNEKIKIFTILMSKRYDIAAEESVNALNMIDVVFYESEKVRSAWKSFLEATNLPDSPTKNPTINDKHLKLLEVIAENIGYKGIRWDDIKQYYYPSVLIICVKTKLSFAEFKSMQVLLKLTSQKNMRNLHKQIPIIKWRLKYLLKL